MSHSVLASRPDAGHPAPTSLLRGLKGSRPFFSSFTLTLSPLGLLYISESLVWELQFSGITRLGWAHMGSSFSTSSPTPVVFYFCLDGGRPRGREMTPHCGSDALH